MLNGATAVHAAAAVAANHCAVVQPPCAAAFVSAGLVCMLGIVTDCGTHGTQWAAQLLLSLGAQAA